MMCSVRVTHGDRKVNTPGHPALENGHGYPLFSACYLPCGHSAAFQPSLPSMLLSTTETWTAVLLIYCLYAIFQSCWFRNAKARTVRPRADRLPVWVPLEGYLASIVVDSDGRLRKFMYADPAHALCMADSSPDIICSGPTTQYSV